MTAPDLFEDVLGYRIWFLRQDGLRSMSRNHRWEAGKNVAECRPRQTLADHASYRRHTAPREECECGFYGWHEVEELDPRDGTRVLGAFRAWGRIAVHNDGFRAQYAEPVVLSIPEATMTISQVHRMDRVAREYGLPLVRRQDFQAAAEEFGSPIPQTLRPKQGRPMDGLFDVYRTQNTPGAVRELMEGRRRARRRYYDVGEALKRLARDVGLR